MSFRSFSRSGLPAQWASRTLVDPSRYKPTEFSLSHPLILTLKLDDALAERLTAQRTRYFPAERNYLAAHVTLFHALPAEHEPTFTNDLAIETAAVPSFAVTVGPPYSLGRGVALEIVGDPIRPLRRRLRDRWLPHLSPQDQTGQIRPHVTIQNKVSGDVARDTLAEVRAKSVDERGTAVGLSLWEYRGGPWAHVRDFLFQD